MLPYPAMGFTPFDTLPAADLDKLVANIEALADGSGQDDASIASIKLVENFIRGRHQSVVGVNTQPTALTIQSGNSYIQGNGTAAISKAITFPTPFSAPPLFTLATINGFRLTSGGTPTGIDTFATAVAAECAAQSYAATATGVSIYLRIEGGSSWSSSSNYGFSWLALGAV